MNEASFLGRLIGYSSGHPRPEEGSSGTSATRVGGVESLSAETFDEGVLEGRELAQYLAEQEVCEGRVPDQDGAVQVRRQDASLHGSLPPEVTIADTGDDPGERPRRGPEHGCAPVVLEAGERRHPGQVLGLCHDLADGSVGESAADDIE